jgi:hypothetical protein
MGRDDGDVRARPEAVALSSAKMSAAYRFAVGSVIAALPMAARLSTACARATSASACPTLESDVVDQMGV